MYACFINHTCKNTYLAIFVHTAIDILSLHTHAGTPNPPVITSVNYSNMSFSLTWTHDRTCFETVPVKYHVLLNTSNQPIITDQMTAEINDVTSGTSYTVSVMAVADDTQRSEVDSVSITAGGCRLVTSI